MIVFVPFVAVHTTTARPVGPPATCGVWTQAPPARPVEICSAKPQDDPAGRTAASTRVTFAVSTRDQVATASPAALTARSLS